MATSKRKDQIHVAVLPWSAFGHIIPFFQLSKSLARAGVSVSFLSTPKNIQRLPKLPPDLEALVNLVELPMPSLDHHLLPPGAEATVDLPSSDKIQYLKVAYDLLREPFRHYVESSKPDWIIVDVIPHWAAEVAVDLGVPLMLFSVYSASTLVFFDPPECDGGDGRRRRRGSPEGWTHPPEWVDFPSSVAYRRFEADAVHAGVYGVNDSGTTDADRYGKTLTACQAVSVHSCYEVEGDYLNLFQKLVRKDVVPVGFLLPDEIGSGSVPRDDEWSKIFNWLDQQNDKSVVFVGFGSECKLTREQVFEIARGLELSELPFLWALRRPSWAADDVDALPPGFRHRTAGRGVVSLGWAPQMEILGHRAVGGSLFHSGWGSVIETLRFGHSLVVLPFIIDQALNARLLVEKGVAVEVERSEVDGSFTGEGLARCLRVAMVEEEGETVRAKAREAAAVFGDKKLHHGHYFNGFVDYLKAGAATAD